ncbi:MAG: hypothetical protein ACLGIK_13075, partial [Gemmatimonadota bacterium]
MFDFEGGLMWLDTNYPRSTDNVPPVYFNAFHITTKSINPNSALLGSGNLVSPTTFDAILGIWKDCNDDGFIGLGETAAQSYPVELGVHNPHICPAGLPEPGSSHDYTHNDGVWIREFIHIGPPCESPERTVSRACIDNPAFLPINGTKVWGDSGPPEVPVRYKCPRVVIPDDPNVTAPDTINWRDCVLYIIDQADEHPFDNRCVYLVHDIHRCLNGDPNGDEDVDQGLVFGCNLPVPLTATETGYVAVLPDYDFHGVRTALLDFPVLPSATDDTASCPPNSGDGGGSGEGWIIYGASEES